MELAYSSMMSNCETYSTEKHLYAFVTDFIRPSTIIELFLDLRIFPYEVLMAVCVGVRIVAFTRIHHHLYKSAVIHISVSPRLPVHEQIVNQNFLFPCLKKRLLATYELETSIEVISTG